MTAPTPQQRLSSPDPHHALPDETSGLLAESSRDPWGEVSVSEYETARLVTLAPDLDGHAARVEFLLKRQRTDGSWGPPGGYALVPTLSAVHALLSCLSTPERDHGASPGRLRHAAQAGLRALEVTDGGTPPDTIAVELTVPALVEAINHLNSSADPAGWQRSLTCPGGIDPRALQAVRTAIAAGGPALMKMWHAWETLNAPEHAGDSVQLAGGTLGGSPAATAAWLTTQSVTAQHTTDARTYLHRLQHRYRGPVPSISAITYFERAWLLCTFAAARMQYTVPAALLDSLEDALTTHGAPAADGLPPDADDTAAVLLALASHGRPRRPDALMDYRADGYFHCFIGERTPSISTNAHVLETLAHHVARRPEDRTRYEASITATTRWFLDAQRADGSWTDKWHASPYYATACCVQALAACPADGTAHARRRSARWVHDTQRPDGGWGRWHSTTEETAYALQILATQCPDYPPAGQALIRGRALLAGDTLPWTPLWHDKDLYTPHRVVAAARLAALHTSAPRQGLVQEGAAR